MVAQDVDRSPLLDNLQRKTVYHQYQNKTLYPSFSSGVQGPSTTKLPEEAQFGNMDLNFIKKRVSAKKDNRPQQKS